MNAVKAATPESALMAFPGATPVRSQHAGGAPAAATAPRRPQRGCASGETG
jgi:hypothetical protein